MLNYEQIPRLLPYDIDGKPIIIEFKAGSGLVAGAEFKLYKKDSLNYLKFWKIGSQDNEASRLVIERDSKLLNKHALTWQILCCTKNIETYNGIITIDFYQGDKKLKPNIPTLRELDNIPPCAVKRYIKFTEALLFIARI